MVSISKEDPTRKFTAENNNKVKQQKMSYKNETPQKYLFPSLLVSFFLSGLTSDLIGGGVICITITMSVQAPFFFLFTFLIPASRVWTFLQRCKNTVERMFWNRQLLMLRR